MLLLRLFNEYKKKGTCKRFFTHKHTGDVTPAGLWVFSRSVSCLTALFLCVCGSFARHRLCGSADGMGVRAKG